MTYQTDATPPAQTAGSDGLRQAAFVVAAILFPLSNWVPSLTGTGRTIGEQSDAASTLLVPWPPAFSIWFVIFVGMLAFAVIQALPSIRERPAFRASGWWFTLAMMLSVCWSLAAAYAPIESSSWITALIFVPYVFAVTEGLVRLRGWAGSLFGHEYWLCLVPAGLFAGWTSLAIFLNWQQVFVTGPLQLPFEEPVIAVGMLGAAVLWIGSVLMRVRGFWAFAFTPIWGLAALAYARLVVGPLSQPVGIAALVGIALVLALAVIGRRRGTV